MNLFGHGCGFYALKQVLECQTAVDDAINRALRSDNDTAFSVRCGVAGMNADAFEVRHIQQERQGLMKALRECDYNLIGASGDGRLARDFSGTHDIFQREARPFSVVYCEDSRSGFAGKSVADEGQLH